MYRKTTTPHFPRKSWMHPALSISTFYVKEIFHTRSGKCIWISFSTGELSCSDDLQVSFLVSSSLVSFSSHDWAIADTRTSSRSRNERPLECWKQPARMHPCSISLFDSTSCRLRGSLPTQRFLTKCRGVRLMCRIRLGPDDDRFFTIFPPGKISHEAPYRSVPWWCEHV